MVLLFTAYALLYKVFHKNVSDVFASARLSVWTDMKQ